VRLIEQDVEAKIIEVFEALDGMPAGVSIEGAWQPSATGEVKGLETEGGGSCRIAVAVGAPSWANWTVMSADLPVAIALSVRRDLAPTAAEVAQVLAPIAAKLIEWQMDDGAESLIAELSTETFEICGIQLEPGEPPEYDAKRHAWFVTRSFALKGTPRTTNQGN